MGTTTPIIYGLRRAPSATARFVNRANHWV